MQWGDVLFKKGIEKSFLSLLCGVWKIGFQKWFFGHSEKPNRSQCTKIWGWAGLALLHLLPNFNPYSPMGTTLTFSKFFTQNLMYFSLADL
jgi:hypothetical protein